MEFEALDLAEVTSSKEDRWLGTTGLEVFFLTKGANEEQQQKNEKTLNKSLDKSFSTKHHAPKTPPALVFRSLVGKEFVRLGCLGGCVKKLVGSLKGGMVRFLATPR